MAMTPTEAVNALDANIKMLGQNELGIGFQVNVEIAQGVFDFVNSLRENAAPVTAEAGIQFTWRGVNCLVV